MCDARELHITNHANVQVVHALSAVVLSGLQVSMMVTRYRVRVVSCSLLVRRRVALANSVACTRDSPIRRYNATFSVDEAPSEL